MCVCVFYAFGSTVWILNLYMHVNTVYSFFFFFKFCSLQNKVQQDFLRNKNGPLNVFLCHLMSRRAFRVRNCPMCHNVPESSLECPLVYDTLRVFIKRFLLFLRVARRSLPFPRVRRGHPNDLLRSFTTSLAKIRLSSCFLLPATRNVIELA